MRKDALNNLRWYFGRQTGCTTSCVDRGPTILRAEAVAV
jgi:hypothetical protein